MIWARVAPALALVAATAVYAWPLLLRDKLPWGMDLSFAAQLTEGMLAGWRDGWLYPRWIDPMSRGYGAPAFVFYPPLTYYVSAGLAALFGSVAEGIRATVVLGTAGAGAALYAAARCHTSVAGATLAGVLYVLLPYHAIDLYDRFAFAELTAFVWTPLLFLFVYRIAAQPSTGAVLGLCLTYAALLFTHLITAYIALFALVPYGVYFALRAGEPRRILWMAAGGAGALVLAAIYVLPALAEQRYVHFEYFSESYFGDWRRNFAFRDETQFGFKPDAIKPAVNHAVASQALLSLVAFALVWWRTERGSRIRQDGIALAAVCAFVTALQLPVSAPLWRIVPELATVQFPWRFGALQGLLTPMLAGMAFARAEALNREALVTAAVLALAALPALYGSAALFEMRDYVFDDRVAQAPRVQSKALLEYTPRELIRWRDLHSQPHQPATRAGAGLTASARVVRWTSHERELAVRTPEPTVVWIATFAHPGWTAFVDGEPSPLEPTASNALLQTAVPAGEHRVVFRMHTTFVRRTGAALSATALIGLVLGAAGQVYRRKRGV